MPGSPASVELAMVRSHEQDLSLIIWPFTHHLARVNQNLRSSPTGFSFYYYMGRLGAAFWHSPTTFTSVSINFIFLLLFLIFGAVIALKHTHQESSLRCSNLLSLLGADDLSLDGVH